MQERCYEPDKTPSQDFRNVGDVLAERSEHVAAVLAEQEKKISEIKTCPGPCRDGKVTIESESSCNKVPCPVISPDCVYGAVLRAHINRCLAELMLTGIGVPRRLAARIDRHVETIAVRESARWDTRGFLVLSGKTGCGKSYAAAWFVKRHLKNVIEDAPIYENFAWNKWRTILESAASRVKWSSAQAVVDDRNIALNAKHCHLLVLDDLGKESNLESAQAIIREVISKRYDGELPTVITSELTVTDIEIRYGRAITERIIGEVDDGGRFITCGEVSMRLANE